MDNVIGKPRVISSTAAGVKLQSSTETALVEIVISSATIEQAFQVASSTEEDRRTLIEENIETIWQIVSQRPDVGQIEIRVSDLAPKAMHMTGKPASRAAD